MKKSINERSEHLIGSWWMSILVGIVAVVIGFIVMINPTQSYFTFTLWLGLVMVITGIIGMAQSLSSHNYFVRRGWIVFAYLLDIFIGIVLMSNLVLSAFMLPVILGVWLLYRGITALIMGLDLKGYGVRDAGWVIFGSAIIIAISLAVLWLPDTLGVEVVVLFVAIAFIAFGATQISLAYRLYDVHRRAKEMM